jgi:Putative Actinobacterial Holin-X, holin superfamily III
MLPSSGKKIQEAKDELSPTSLLHRGALIFTALAFIAGFSLGFFFRRSRRALEQVDKPATRALLIAPGTYAVTSVGKKAARGAVQATLASELITTRTENANYQITSAEQTNWPALFSKTVNDLADIGRTEIELLEATLKRLIEAQADKIVGMIVMAVFLIYGSLFVLAGIVLLIHLWLAWWIAFLITGGAVSAAGVLFLMTMMTAARAKCA